MSSPSFTAPDHAACSSARSNARRDARISGIHEGTSEIRRLVIAGHETGLR